MFASADGVLCFAVFLLQLMRAESENKNPEREDFVRRTDLDLNIPHGHVVKRGRSPAVWLAGWLAGLEASQVARVVRARNRTKLTIDRRQGNV
jgi:hypothetical protein